MLYQEYEIAENLKPYVKVIWSMESDLDVVDGPTTYILPDACVELVFHFGDPYKTTLSDNSISVQAQSFVVAQMKSFMTIQSNGKTGIIAVRFSALGAYHFFGVPMKEIANGETGLSNLWKDTAREASVSPPRHNRLISALVGLSEGVQGFVCQTPMIRFR